MMIRASYTCDICHCHLTVLDAKIVPNHETKGNYLMCEACRYKHYSNDAESERLVQDD